MKDEVKIIAALKLEVDRLRKELARVEALQLSGDVAELTRELEVAKGNAKRASRTKDEFVARMNHEIRSPMNAVVGLSNLALRTMLSPTQLDYIKKIRTTSYSLLCILDDVMDFSKLEDNAIELYESEFVLHDMVDRIAKWATTEAYNKGLEFSVVLDESVPGILFGDYLRLEQILENLVGNAMKFTFQGQVELKTSLLFRNEEQVTLRFAVQDTGIGIPEDQIDTLFDSFSRKDDSLSCKYGGAGFGLAVCKHLAEKMNGNLIVSSEPGKGSTFFLTVSVKTVDMKQEQAISLPDRPFRALVVDDDSNTRMLLMKYLTDFSIDSVGVESGELALEELEKHSHEKYFDIIIMDWLMDGKDGLETYQAMQDSAERKALPPVIMLSAHSRRELVEQAERLGVSAFLFKPVNSSLLYSVIKDVLDVDEDANDEPYLVNVRVDESQGALQGVRVLLVEDNPINQQVVRENLENWGMRVHSAYTGKEALEALEQDDYDAVLMDIQMPEMDGITATKHIRGNFAYDSMPIIAVTAHTMEEDKRQCKEAGMDGYVSKPVDPDLLLEELTKQLAGKTRVQSARGDESEATGLKQERVEIHEAELGEDVSMPVNLEDNDYPGFHVKNGLKRLGGNKELYLTLIQVFVDDYHDTPEKIRTALGKGEKELALRLAHTVKGVAGNISADAMYGDAQGVENAIVKDDALALESALQVFQEGLSEVMESAGKMLGGKAADSMQGDEAQKAETELQLPVTGAMPSLRILVADDAKTMQEVVRSLLQELGHEVVVVSDGREVFRTLYRQWKSSRNFDMIFMDIEMPVMGGVEATRRIRTHKSSSQTARFDPNIPIVAMSAHSSPEKKQEFFDAGMDDCIDKTADIDTLRNFLEVFYNKMLAAKTQWVRGAAGDFVGESCEREADNNDFLGCADSQVNQSVTNSSGSQEVSGPSKGLESSGAPDQLLEKLQLQVERNSLDAMDTLSALMSFVGEQAQKELKQIKVVLDSFDFTQANELLDGVRARISNERGEG